MYILDVCNDISILGVILFIKKLLSIISYIVPAILVLLITIDFTKAVMASNDDDIKKAQHLSIKRIIAGLIVFFVPLIVETSFSFLENVGTSWASCYNAATEEKVQSLMNEAKSIEEAKEKERQTGISKTLETRKKKQEEDKLLRERAVAQATSKIVNAAQQTGNAVASTCINCTGSEKIAQTAEQLAWPNGTSKSVWHHNYPKKKKFKKWSELTGAKPTQAFMNAFDQMYPNHWTSMYTKKYGGWPAIGASCDRFVATVVKYSGYDTIPTGLANQLKDLPNSAKWKKVASAGRGDICIKSSHVKIYLGNGLQAEAGYNTKKFGR